MAETLYRKYRPKNFSEVVGQVHIVRTLTNSIKHSRVGHAYLFTGPRGTGKTSIARIFAKAINCEKPSEAISCEKCPACSLINENRSLDIIEIDAASNTSVDNIRELRETIAMPPTALKYKVYIIDEAHMLSTGAFNALLKTLEEPPAHVVFILATTEIHKVPETIISRCQRFDFSRFPVEQIIERLSALAKAEKVKIQPEALEMIALSAEGGMRDAESLLGQIIALEDKEITATEVEEILGTTDRKIAYDTARLMIDKDTTAAIDQINKLQDDGYDLEVFTKALVNYFRQLMLLKVNAQLKEHFAFEMTSEQLKAMTELVARSELAKLIEIINLLIEAQAKISSSMIAQLPLEIAIIKATQNLPQPERPVQSSINPPPSDLSSDEKPKNPPTEKNASATILSPTQPPADLPEKDLEFFTVKSNWCRLLTDIQPHNHSLKALLSNCQLKEVKGSTVTLATAYDFYLEKLNDPKNRLTVEEVFGKILGCRVKINIMIDKTIAPKAEEDAAQCDDKPHDQESLLNSAMEIMGGKIVE